MADQNSTNPTDTAHLRAGERITLDEFATHLSAVAVWLRQLAVAGERPAVPVEMVRVCDDLERTADNLTGTAKLLAEVDAIITEERPLRRTFGGTEPWGFAAFGADTDKTKYGKTLSTVLSPWQIQALTRDDTPWRADQAEPGIAYLDGLDGLPELDRWESTRGARRRAEQREKRILAQTLQEHCESCGAEPGRECKTRTGRLAEMFHQPRRRKAVVTVDAELAISPIV